MTLSSEVRLWGVRRRKTEIPSWEVRWVVAGRERSRSRRTKALAEAFLSDLRQAARRGEPFDVATGLPQSMAPSPAATSWLDFVQSYIDMKWPGAAGKTRDSMTDALATVTAALVDDPDNAPDPWLLRAALRQHLLPPSARGLPRSADVEDAVLWLAKHSVPLTELATARQLRRALDALTLNLDGAPAARTTVNRKRAVFHNALQYAVELERLPANNLARVGWRAPKVTDVVDRRVVINPRQAEELLTAVTYVGPVDRGRHLRFRRVSWRSCVRTSRSSARRRAGGCSIPAAEACSARHTARRGQSRGPSPSLPAKSRLRWPTVRMRCVMRRCRCG